MLSQEPQTPKLEAKQAPFLSLVVPCFNEADGIAETIHALVKYMNEHQAWADYELILVNDGSTDSTAKVLDSEVDRSPTRLRALHLPLNMGRGAALRTGLKSAQGKIVITLDADLSYDVFHIGEILNEFEKDPRTDAVIVSPYAAEGKVRNVPFLRLLISRSANFILRGFFSERLSTVTCVVRGYRTEIVRELPLFENGKEFHLEILRKLIIISAKVKEIPGRLVWSADKPRRKIKLSILSAARKHLLWGLLAGPTRLYKYTAALLISLGLYEIITIARVTLYNLSPHPMGFWRSLWVALSTAYTQSPHTFFLAGFALILGFQQLNQYTLLTISQMQHEELLKHLLNLSTQKTSKTETSGAG